MPEPADAFFISDGDAFVAQPCTRGPWDPRFQHGGPPSALMLRALEREAAERGDFQCARLAVEYVRPVPIAALQLETQGLRAGRSVLTLRARLLCDGVEVAHAEGLFLLREPLADLPAQPTVAALPAPETLEPFVFDFFEEPVGYHTAMELRWVRGSWGNGPTAAWMRQRVPLVAGEEPSGWQRAVICADAQSGVGPPLPPGGHTFLNPDLTVHLHRPPEGEWIGLEVSSVAEPSGVGLASAVLHDRRGPIGRSAQSLLVRRH